MGNEVLASFLTAYLEIVLEFVFFPQIFKTAKVIPVPKTRKRNLTNNYQPICLLPSLSKVLEKLIKICWLKFLISTKFYMKISLVSEKSTAHCMPYWMLLRRPTMQSRPSRIDPWGTPISTALEDDVVELWDTN